ncbi:MAG: hypothetical protein FWD75_06215 [Propionibacteriaceae bacterium]|nr:hypothetical protein [Propionibacteriaceae bacterium]
MFDDSLLDDATVLRDRGERLRALALTGARLRGEHTDEMSAVVAPLEGVRPRSVLVMGAEARLIRAVLEPSCPVPCVAWPMTTLPAWAGPLDMVVILAGADDRLLAACREALKRGSLLFVVAPRESVIHDQAGAMAMLMTHEDDPFVAAVLALKVLDRLGLGPAIDLDQVADVLDLVADECGPRHGLEANPAKNLACALADAVPLVWGGSTLAARASRRVAEALRETTGFPALAADDHALAPLIVRSRPRDLFADPFESRGDSITFCVLILDDGDYPLAGVDLVRIAESRNVRVDWIRADESNPVLRYASLLYQGLFAAAYLELASVRE